MDTENNIFNLMKKEWKFITNVAFITAAITFTVSAFLPARYRASISVLVIQKQATSKVDAFSAAKSAEYLSNILSKIIYTEAFLKDVESAPYGIKFTKNKSTEERKEEWKREVKVKKLNNTGIIEVDIFNRTPQQAEKIARAIAWAYSVRGHKYHGGGDRVKIELIDGPITSKVPVKPNLILNTLLGLLVGMLGTMAYLYFLDEGHSQKPFEKIKKSGIDLSVRRHFKKNNEEGERHFPNIREQSRKLFSSLKREKAQGEFYQTFFGEENYFKQNKVVSGKIKLQKTRKEETISSPAPKKEEAIASIVTEKEAPVVTMIPEKGKKAAAPDNLPIFKEEMNDKGVKESTRKTDIRKQEVKESMLQFTYKKLDNQKKEGYIAMSTLESADKKLEEAPEPTEEEIKERLNRLLRGDL